MKKGATSCALSPRPPTADHEQSPRKKRLLPYVLPYVERPSTETTTKIPHKRRGDKKKKNNNMTGYYELQDGKDDGRTLHIYGDAFDCLDSSHITSLSTNLFCRFVAIDRVRKFFLFFSIFLS